MFSMCSMQNVLTQASKFINHTPTVFEQFHLLEMMAPTTYAEIPSTIATLQMKVGIHMRATIFTCVRSPDSSNTMIK